MVVVKDAADAAGFTAVLQIEVFIAPGLEHLVQIRVNRITGRLMGAMEMTGVVEKRVVRRQVGTAAEPPHRARLEVAVVEVNRRDVGVARMQNH